MKSYCLVEDGELVLGPQPLPLSFKNISNFNYLSDEELHVFGWLPASIENTPGEVFVENQTVITENEVRFIKVYRDKTEEEIKSIAEQAFKAMWDEFRQTRDNLLKATDMHMLLDNWGKLSVDDQEKLIAYRQNLRDLPTTVEDPVNFTFPVLPF